MNRRNFLRSAGAVSASLALTKTECLLAEGAASDGWRTFEVKTRVEILKSSGAARVWLPAAIGSKTPFQKTLANEFTSEGGTARIVEGRTDGLGIIAAEFPAGVKPVLTVTSRVATKTYAVDLSSPGKAPKADRAELEHFLRPTKLLPTDGIVKTAATEITSGAKTDLEKARAIYEWIVDNTFRNPKTRGCGIGDIRFMLESKDLGGKCADLNALYVGLARAAGLPARDVYGIRVAKSELGYKSLGTLEEPPGNRPLDDEMVKKARARLFGSWEMNWMAYNFAHDVALPGSAGAPVGFLMYPQAETADGRLDSLDPESFQYEVTSREISSANG
jgi:hypothetical protein